MWITNGNLADIAIVWAKTDDGIQGFVVEKGFAGFTAHEIKHKMSLRASVTCEPVLRQRARARAEPAAEREGPEGPAGVPDAGALRHHLGPDGRGDRLPRRGIDYSKERILFGRRSRPRRARSSSWPTWRAASPPAS